MCIWGYSFLCSILPVNKFLSTFSFPESHEILWSVNRSSFLFSFVCFHSCFRWGLGEGNVNTPSPSSILDPTKQEFLNGPIKHHCFFEGIFNTWVPISANKTTLSFLISQGQVRESITHTTKQNPGTCQKWCSPFNSVTRHLV